MLTQISLSIALVYMLTNNQLNKTNAIVLIREIMERLEEKDAPSIDDHDKIKFVVHFLKDIAKGKDGIMGSQDDIIPIDVLIDIQKMAETNVLQDVISLCKDIIHKKKVNPMRLSLCCLKIT